MSLTAKLRDSTMYLKSQEFAQLFIQYNGNTTTTTTTTTTNYFLPYLIARAGEPSHIEATTNLSEGDTLEVFAGKPGERLFTKFLSYIVSSGFVGKQGDNRLHSGIPLDILLCVEIS